MHVMQEQINACNAIMIFGLHEWSFKSFSLIKSWMQNRVSTPTSIWGLANFLDFYFLGEYNGSMFNLCTIKFGSTPKTLYGLHTKTSKFRTNTNKSSTLSLVGRLLPTWKYLSSSRRMCILSNSSALSAQCNAWGLVIAIRGWLDLLLLLALMSDRDYHALPSYALIPSHNYYPLFSREFHFQMQRGWHNSHCMNP